MERNNLGEDLVELFFSIGRLIRERMNADTDAMPYLHLVTLQYIAEKGQPLMREIAHYLRITPPSATSLINALVKSKHIKRTNDPKDRRTVRLTLTARGQKSLEDGMEKKRIHVQHLISALSEREREDLKTILAKINSISA